MTIACSNPIYFRLDLVSPIVRDHQHPSAQTSMSDPTVYWCVCRRYCKGIRRALHTRNTWRRHLREASSEDEKEAIRLAGRSEEFRAFIL